MASLWTRITGKTEKRSAQPTIPSRAATVVTPDAALSLTAVYRACQIIATPISKMTVETYRYASGVGDLKIENPLLVNKPSLYDSRRDFFFQTVVSLATDGNAFWLKDLDSRGNVNNLTILPASSVSVTWNEAKTAKIYNYAGTDITGRVEHLKLFSKVGDLRGVSPIASCYRDIAAALDLRDYAANWFSSAGVPTGIIKSNRIITKDEAVEMTANWHNKQQNRQTAVLGSGDSYEIVQLSPKDALFTDVQNQAVQAIARLMGIPARLLLTSTPGGSDTYTNLQDENQVFYRHTLMGYTDPIADALSNCLPRGTRVEFNFESLFKADISERYGYYKVGVDGGWLTTEEVRTKEGL
jgi:HK97 family phage portal protein